MLQELQNTVHACILFPKVCFLLTVQWFADCVYYSMEKGIIINASGNRNNLKLKNIKFVLMYIERFVLFFSTNLTTFC